MRRRTCVRTFLQALAGARRAGQDLPRAVSQVVQAELGGDLRAKWSDTQRDDQITGQMRKRAAWGLHSSVTRMIIDTPAMGEKHIAGPLGKIIDSGVRGTNQQSAYLSGGQGVQEVLLVGHHQQGHVRELLLLARAQRKARREKSHSAEKEQRLLVQHSQSKTNRQRN